MPLSFLAAAGGGGGGGGDGLDGAHVVSEAGFSLFLATVTLSGVTHHRIGADAVTQQCQRAVHCGVRPGDARNREPDGFDASEVMAGIIQIKNLFRQIDEAFAGLFQIDQREGIQHGERDALGHCCPVEA